jgi:hypothetical protein
MIIVYAVTQSVTPALSKTELKYENHEGFATWLRIPSWTTRVLRLTSCTLYFIPSVCICGLNHICHYNRHEFVTQGNIFADSSDSCALKPSYHSQNLEQINEPDQKHGLGRFFTTGLISGDING